MPRARSRSEAVKTISRLLPCDGRRPGEESTEVGLSLLHRPVEADHGEAGMHLIAEQPRSVGLLLAHHRAGGRWHPCSARCARPGRDAGAGKVGRRTTACARSVKSVQAMSHAASHSASTHRAVTSSLEAAAVWQYRLTQAKPLLGKSVERKPRAQLRPGEPGTKR